MRYDYFCASNGRTVEVSHSMTDQLTNWGDLCKMAGIEIDNTPLDSPVERIISGGSFAMIKGDQKWHSSPRTDCMCNNDSCTPIPACACSGKCPHR